MKSLVNFIVLLSTCCLVFSLSDKIWAQDTPTGLPLKNEPIGFIGHGKIFSKSGDEIDSSVSGLLSIQVYYAAQFNAVLTVAEQQVYNQYRAELIAQWQEIRSDNDPVEFSRQQLVVNSLLFKKQLELYNPADQGRLSGINSLLAKYALEPFIGLEQAKWETLVGTSQFLQWYGRKKDVGTIGPGILFLATNLGGQPYLDECAENGVPTPPPWRSAEWVSSGSLDDSEEFISRGLVARPYVYQSSSPEGACIALPRTFGSTATTAGLLGIICVGKESGNSCFWDNQTFECDDDPDTACPEPYNISMNPSVPLEIVDAFLGGAELFGGGGGQCSACHAGENPFVIHPGSDLGHPALDVGGIVTETMPDKFHDPIVHPLWYQNERSSTLTDTPEGSGCAGCHGAKPAGVTGITDGGRLPQLSPAIRGNGGYCNAVIKNAININIGNPDNTMPLGGSLTETAHDELLDLINDFCDNATDPGKTTGDPHIKTTNGVKYDFHAAGEFTLLQGSDDFEVQTRQAAIPTSFFPGANSHTGVASCVSVNTGLATKIGGQRITYQSDIDGNPSPNSMELRIDGVVTPLTNSPITLSSGGRLMRSVADGLEIEFPNGAYLSAVPGYWNSQNQWTLNISLSGTEANRGLMGVVPRDSWLPRLRTGASLGARPASQAARYDLLNTTFADSWRVSDAGSLFDYAVGQNTSSYELPGWPKSAPDCIVPDRTATPPATEAAARVACSGIIDVDDRANCEFDFVLTGADVFVDVAMREQNLRRWGTKTQISIVTGRKGPVEERIYAVSVTPRWPGLTRQPSGSVEVSVDGEVVGSDRPLDRNGLAILDGGEISDKEEGAIITAVYTPAPDSEYLPSSSPEVEFIPGSDAGSGAPPSGQETDKLYFLWIILVILALLTILLLIVALRKHPQ